MDRRSRLFTASSYVLVVLFGTASWLSVNAVYIELPVIVFELPESWELPAYLAVIVQMATIGPLLYALFDWLWPLKMRLPLVIYTLLALAVLTTFVLLFAWNQTSFVAGGPRSTVLFALFFLLCIVDCTSNVTFLPYMSKFEPRFTTAYFIGMGFSGLVPSLLAIIQGSERTECVWTNSSLGDGRWMTKYGPRSVPPRFGFAAFNCVILVFLLLSLCCYALLERVVLKAHIAKSLQRCLSAPTADERTAIAPTTARDSELAAENAAVAETAPLDSSDTVCVMGDSSQPGGAMSRCSFAMLLCMTGFVCALQNGVLPSIQSYACLPYGQSTYHWAVVLANLANPVACFLPMFISALRWQLALCWTSLLAALSAFLVSMAALSPHPLLVGTKGGSAVTVLLWIGTFGLCAYLRAEMAGQLRERGRGSRALVWCGLATQLGSFVGAVLMFPLVSVLHVFKPATFCSNQTQTTLTMQIELINELRSF